MKLSHYYSQIIVHHYLTRALDLAWLGSIIRVGTVAITPDSTRKHIKNHSTSEHCGFRG
jgi:hypothetical protein